MQSDTAFRFAALPLLGALAANAAAQSFLLVALPGIGRDLGFSTLETGLLLGLPALFLLASAPVWGRTSEFRGRRLVLVAGLVAAAAGPALIGATIGLRLAGILDRGPALATLFAIRLVQALVSGGLLPAAQAWMADRTTPEQRTEAMGLLGASYGVGGIAGAAVAFGFGGRMPVEALSGLAAAVTIGLVLVSIFIHDRPVCAAGVPPSSTATILRRITPCLAVTFLGVAVYGVMQHVTVMRMEDAFALARADAISRAGAALMIAAGSMVLMQAFGLRLLRLAPHRLVQAGAAVAALAMAGAIFAQQPITLMAALGVMGLALGMALPGNLGFLSLLAGPFAQGRAAGVNAVAQGLGMAAGPVAGAALHRISPLAPALACAAAMALALIIASSAQPRPRS